MVKITLVALRKCESKLMLLTRRSPCDCKSSDPIIVPKYLN